MTGGQSAREQAEDAKARGAALQRRADKLSHKGDNYEQGARGEEDVSWELDQLATDGWLVMHDRRLPTRANLDHLLVGPPGVSVIETKNWTGDLAVEDGHVSVNGRRKLKEMKQVSGQVDAVRDALATDQPDLPVQGYLVMAGPHHRDQPPVEIDGTIVVGLYRITAHLGVANVTTTQSQIEAGFRTLSVAFPSASEPTPPAAQQSERTLDDAAATSTETAPPKALPPAHRYFYLRIWQRFGKHHVYLRTVDGSRLGWKDMKSGAVTVEADDKDLAKLAAAVLAATQPASVAMAVGDLPKVKTDLLGAGLLRRLGRVHMAVVVGYEWKNRGKHRLYGTYLAPETAAIKLGYVDLTTGKLFVDIDGSVHKDRPTATQLLEGLAAHLPAPEPTA